MGIKLYPNMSTITKDCHGKQLIKINQNPYSNGNSNKQVLIIN